MVQRKVLEPCRQDRGLRVVGAVPAFAQGADMAGCKHRFFSDGILGARFGETPIFLVIMRPCNITQAIVMLYVVNLLW
jgi:hypothetical protein